MCARHIKRAIEEFNIKLPKRLEEKEEKKPAIQYNCQVFNLFINIQKLSLLVCIHYSVSWENLIYTALKLKIIIGGFGDTCTCSFMNLINILHTQVYKLNILHCNPSSYYFVRITQCNSFFFKGRSKV